MVSKRLLGLVLGTVMLALTLTACPSRPTPPVDSSQDAAAVAAFNRKSCALVAEAAQLRQQIEGMDGPPTPAMRQRMEGLLDIARQLQHTIPRQHPEQDSLTSRFELLTSYHPEDFQTRRFFIDFAEDTARLGDLASCEP